MKAWVTPLNAKGKPLPDAKLRVVCGDLNVADHLHPLLGRLVKEAEIRDTRNTHVTLPMIDVTLDGIFGVGLRLRGVELDGETHYAQAWWVRFEQPEN